MLKASSFNHEMILKIFRGIISLFSLFYGKLPNIGWFYSLLKDIFRTSYLWTTLTIYCHLNSGSCLHPATQRPRCKLTLVHSPFEVVVNNRHVFSQVKIRQLLRYLNFKKIQVSKFLSFILSRIVDLQFTWSSYSVSIILRRHF